MYLLSALLLILVSPTFAGGLSADLETFVQKAVPEGRIIFSGTVETAGTTYELFLLEQERRRGALVVANNADIRKVLFADTSLDVAATRRLIPQDVLKQLERLLTRGETLANQHRTSATEHDIYPIGAALNIVLGPIAGFTFGANGTLGILDELEQSDAMAVSPNAAPVGSILVCPTTCSSTGPVSLGSVAILGPDRKVYEPDFRKGSTWISPGTLEDWVRKYGARNQLFGFLLRAHPDRP